MSRLLNQFDQIFCILKAVAWAVYRVAAARKAGSAEFPTVRGDVCLDQRDQPVHCLLLATLELLLAANSGRSAPFQKPFFGCHRLIPGIGRGRNRGDCRFAGAGQRRTRGGERRACHHQYQCESMIHQRFLGFRL